MPVVWEKNKKEENIRKRYRQRTKHSQILCLKLISLGISWTFLQWILSIAILSSGILSIGKA